MLRVGGNKLVPFDARIIVATNRNLWDLVQNNVFREDLYYRLDVLELEIPPLRERKEDIILLFLRFLKALSPDVWNIISLISEELEKHLCEYNWPGNIRELENFTHTLVASIKPGDPPLQLIMLIVDSLKRKQLRSKPVSPPPEPAIAPDALPGALPGTLTEDKPLITEAADSAPPSPSASVIDIKSLTDKKIQETLEACNGNIPQAAYLLGIHRTTLWRKIRKGMTT